MVRSVWDRPAGVELRDQFRAESRALEALFEARRPGGKHNHEKGMRREEVLLEFLRRHLPPRYGLARGEIMDSEGGLSRQCDVVVYDALHSPMVQRSEASRLFPAECVYAVIEVKPALYRGDLSRGAENIRAAKALDRSAIVAHHGGHRLCHGPRANPPIFGAIFSLKSGPAKELIVPTLDKLHATLPRAQWVDCVCVAGDTLVYHFDIEPGGRWPLDWAPAVLSEDSCIGYYQSGADTLLLFTLFLLWQLNARELFPPDLLRYVSGLEMCGPTVRVPGMLPLAAGGQAR